LTNRIFERFDEIFERFDENKSFRIKSVLTNSLGFAKTQRFDEEI